MAINEFRTAPVPRLLLKLAVPSSLAAIINVLYSIVDRMFIGHIPEVGSTALAAVGICGPIVTFLSSFGNLIGLGGSIQFSIRNGEGNTEEAEKILANSFLMLSVISLVLTGIFLLIKGKIILLFGGSPVTFDYANRYLTIYTLGSFFAIMTIGLNFFITTQDFPKVAMASVATGACTNIVLDAIFIRVFGWGISGAAVATVISQIVSCMIAMGFLFSRKVPIRITFGNYSAKLMRKIVTFGISPFLIISLDSMIIIILNSMLQKHGGPVEGDILISASTIITSLYLLSCAPIGGITGGAQAIVSYNYGAGQSDRVKQTIKYTLIYVTACTLTMFLVSRYLNIYFIRLFTDSERITEVSQWGIKVYHLMIIALGVQWTIVDISTALGRIKTSLTLSLYRKSIFLIVCVLFPIFFEAKSAFYAEPISDIISMCTSSVVFALYLNRHLKKREEYLRSVE